MCNCKLALQLARMIKDVVDDAMKKMAGVLPWNLKKKHMLASRLLISCYVNY
jgi:hypothetical protein